MFRSLRNRLIFINLAVTTAVLMIAFSAIYVVAQGAAQQRQTITTDILPSGTTKIVFQTINERIQYERKESLRSLLISLLTVGFAVEVAVAVLSYILAEAAILPIKKTYETQKVFIANASHEMKTPIAAIMANLEVADIQGNQWIDNVSHEVKSLAALNQDLLALARAENAITINKTTEPVVLRSYVESIIAPFQPRIDAKKINYQLKTNLKTGKVKLVKSDFREIVTILLDNAIKYCNRSIIIVLTSKKITIENDGRLISKSDLPHIFDRFYQTDKSSEGVGLGLAIAKTLADRQGWHLHAESSEASKTTSFTLEF